MRRGEILSRQWKHYRPDLAEYGVIDVGATDDFKTKTRQSIRRVPLFPRSDSVIRRRLEKRQRTTDPNEFIFLAPRGGAIGRDWLSKRSVAVIFVQ